MTYEEAKRKLETMLCRDGNLECEIIRSCKEECEEYIALKTAIEALELAERIECTNHICIHCKHNKYGDCETINAVKCPFDDFDEVTE